MDQDKNIDEFIQIMDELDDLIDSCDLIVYDTEKDYCGRSYHTNKGDIRIEINRNINNKITSYGITYNSKHVAIKATSIPAESRLDSIREDLWSLYRSGHPHTGEEDEELELSDYDMIKEGVYEF